MSSGNERRVWPGRLVVEWALVINFATLLWAIRRLERPEGSRGGLDVRTVVQSGVTVYVLCLGFGHSD